MVFEVPILLGKCKISFPVLGNVTPVTATVTVCEEAPTVLEEEEIET